MTRTQKRAWGLAALLVFLLAGATAVGSAGEYAVDWQVLNGSGAPAASASGLVALNGSLGQTAIGSSSGPGVTVGAGFWYGLGGGVYRLFLPVVLRNYG